MIWRKERLICRALSRSIRRPSTPAQRKPVPSHFPSISTIRTRRYSGRQDQLARSLTMKELRLSYPELRREDLVENLHGHKVADPYRYLEDPDSEETTAFVAAQNKLWDAVNDQFSFKEELKEQLAEMYNYEKYSTPFQRGDRYFYFYNTGLQNQDCIYEQTSLDAEPKLFFDPNKLSTDGTASINVQKFSDNLEKTGKFYYAYGISRSGSDWTTVYVKDVLTGRQLDDCIEWVKFSSLPWSPDDEGFFYSRYPEPKALSGTDASADDCKRGSEVDKNHNHQVFYHKLGTPQKEDVLIFEDPANPENNHGAAVTHDGKYLLIYTRDGCKNANKLHVAELYEGWAARVKNEGRENALCFIPLAPTFDAAFSYLFNEGDVFYFETNLDAPRNRIVKCKLSASPVWEEVVAQPGPNAVLSSALVLKESLLVVTYLEDVKDVVRIYSLDGGFKGELQLPGIGTVALSGKEKGHELFFKFTSFTNPGDVYRVDFSDFSDSLPVPQLFRRIHVQGLITDEMETNQVFYHSKDGTKIPMFIMHRKGLKRDGDNPTLLYGYGGFNIPIPPSFSSLRMPFIQNFGGVFAVANLRGGGEYGEEWHQLGTFGKKQNVFDDFQAAAEYLIAEKYTRKEKLGIFGGSNGGLLVSACLNQRPDLYAAGVAAVGVLDMLRFHKFTIGHAWKTDYGDPDKEEDFSYLYKYSPLHNIPAEGDYPATLLMTADHDDRVVPLHSFKFIAELQHKLGATAGQKVPLVIRIESKAGHGAGKPTSKRIEEQADLYSFLLYAFGIRKSDKSYL